MFQRWRGPAPMSLRPGPVIGVLDPPTPWLLLTLCPEDIPGVKKPALLPPGMRTEPGVCMAPGPAGPPLFGVTTLGPALSEAAATLPDIAPDSWGAWPEAIELPGPAGLARVECARYRCKFSSQYARCVPQMVLCLGPPARQPSLGLLYGVVSASHWQDELQAHDPVSAACPPCVLVSCLPTHLRSAGRRLT